MKKAVLGVTALCLLGGILAGTNPVSWAFGGSNLNNPMQDGVGPAMDR